MRLALVFLVGCGSSTFLAPDGGFADDEPFPNDGGGPVTPVDATVCTMTCGGACADTTRDPMHCGSCDHACSGAASECVSSTCVVPHATRWAAAFPGQINAVATDEFDHVFATGAFSGTLDLGQGIVLTSAGDTDAFVGAWNVDGVPLWATRLGGTGADAGTALLYSNGNLYLGMAFSGTISVLDTFVSHGGTDVLVVQLISGTGGLASVDQYGSAGDDTVRALAYNPFSGVEVCGAFGGPSFSAPGGTLTSQAMSTAYVAPFLSGGLSRTLGDRTAGHTSTCAGLGIDSVGVVTVAGTFDGSATFGNTPITVPSQTGFLASYQSTNLLDWVHVFTGGTSSVSALALDAMGEPHVVGNFSGTVDFGNGPLTASTASDGFFVGFTRSGNPTLARRYGDAVAFAGIAFAGSDVIATGRVSSGADFGTALGGDDLFVARLSGTAVTAKRFGGSGADGGTAVAVATDGTIAVGGAITGSVDVGTGPLAGPALLLQIDP